MNDWVTVAYNVGLVEVAVLKDKFEEEGIPFITTGSNSAYPSISAVQGGIKIQVSANDEERALEIVKQAGYME